MNDPSSTPPSARASSNCLRIALVVGVMISVTLGIGLFLWSRSEDPAFVRSVLADMLPADVPPGFKPLRAFPLPIRNLQFVTLAPNATELDSGPGGAQFVINVNAIPEGMEPQAFMDRLTGDWLAKDSARNLAVDVQLELEVMVRGRKTAAHLVEGKLQATESPIRFVFVPLLQRADDPESGWVLVTCMGPPGAFDDAGMQAFLAGVK